MRSFAMGLGVIAGRCDHAYSAIGSLYPDVPRRMMRDGRAAGAQHAPHGVQHGRADGQVSVQAGGAQAPPAELCGRIPT